MKLIGLNEGSVRLGGGRRFMLTMVSEHELSLNGLSKGTADHRFNLGRYVLIRGVITTLIESFPYCERDWNIWIIVPAAVITSIEERLYV